jgi:hypothetical protein
VQHIPQGVHRVVRELHRLVARVALDLHALEQICKRLNRQAAPGCAAAPAGSPDVSLTFLRIAVSLCRRVATHPMLRDGVHARRVHQQPRTPLLRDGPTIANVPASCSTALPSVQRYQPEAVPQGSPPLLRSSTDTCLTFRLLFPFD